MLVSCNKQKQLLLVIGSQECEVIENRKNGVSGKYIASNWPGHCDRVRCIHKPIGSRERTSTDKCTTASKVVTTLYSIRTERKRIISKIEVTTSARNLGSELSLYSPN